MVGNARNADCDFMADKKLEQDVRSKISSGQTVDDEFGREIAEAIEEVESPTAPASDLVRSEPELECAA